MSRILVTGANGFVGRRLSRTLVAEGHEVLGSVRRANTLIAAPWLRWVETGDISEQSDWRSALENVSAVVHLASRVHVMNDDSADPLAEYRKVNVDATLSLAEQASVSGVKRFVFVSSVKVNGEGTELGRPYTAESPPAPVDPYGVSKLEAEQGLRELAASSRMEVVIVRPPLVYGPGVKANFLKMMQVLAKGIPLPLGAVHNRRSLISLDNLVSVLTVCIGHPAAGNRVFLVADGEDLSTPDLMRRVGGALGKPARLFPFPAAVLKSGAGLLGKSGAADRLLGSLQIDIKRTCRVLEWSPPNSVDAEIEKTARHFLGQQV